MALIKLGPTVTDIRGSIAGTTFSRNRYGNYIRARTTPVNPNSERQQAVRNIMAYVVQAWYSVLTAGQRAAWSVYADACNFTNKLGESITLTGYNIFVRSNIARLNDDYSLVATGPTELILPPTDPDFSVAISEASQEVTVTFDDGLDWCGENSAKMTIHQGVPKNSATMFYGNHFRALGILEGSAGSSLTSPQVLDVDFPVAEDQKNWCFGRIQRADGRLSIPFRDVCIVSA